MCQKSIHSNVCDGYTYDLVEHVLTKNKSTAHLKTIQCHKNSLYIEHLKSYMYLFVK